MPEIYRHTISDQPLPIAVFSEAATLADGATLTGFEFGTGSVAIDTAASLPLKPEDLTYAVFAALGMSNTQIGSTFKMPAYSVHDRIHKLHDYRQVQNLRSENVANPRAAISRDLFENDTLRVVRHSAALVLPSPQNTSESDTQRLTLLKILRLTSLGYGNAEIGEKLDLGRYTVAHKLTELGRHANVQGREQVVMAGFVSGELVKRQRPVAPSHSEARSNHSLGRASLRIPVRVRVNIGTSGGLPSAFLPRA